jgi:hypothetical protein
MQAVGLSATALNVNLAMSQPTASASAQPSYLSSCRQMFTLTRYDGLSLAFAEIENGKACCHLWIGS